MLSVFCATTFAKVISEILNFYEKHRKSVKFHVVFNFYMDRILSLLSRLKNNGVDQNTSLYDRERLGVINLLLVICIFLSCCWLLVSLVFTIHQHLPFATINVLLWTLPYVLLGRGQLVSANLVFVLGSNFSVISSMSTFGFDAGFYLYYFTTPLFIFLIFTEDQKHWRILSLLSYIISFAVFYVIDKQGFVSYLYSLPPVYLPVMYVYNLFMSFALCYLLVHFFIGLDKIRLSEMGKAHSIQLKLESEVLMKELLASKAQNQVLKLQDEYKQLDLFNYIVSHNLRGPLNRIKGLSKLLQIGSELDREEVLTHMADSVVKLEEMVSDLNNVLANRKKGQEAKSKVRFQEIVEVVKQNLEEEINTSKADISVKGDVLEIYSIKSIWLSVLQNLISNAVKYSKPDVNPKIEIICKSEDEFVEVSVQDNGLGFDLDAYKDQVFQLYNRFHTNLPGKGMGLYLVKSHVNMLDATIELFSKPNEGSLFVIKIPKDWA